MRSLPSVHVQAWSSDSVGPRVAVTYRRLNLDHRRALCWINFPAGTHKAPHLWTEANCCGPRVLIDIGLALREGLKRSSDDRHRKRLRTPEPDLGAGPCQWMAESEDRDDAEPPNMRSTKRRKITMERKTEDRVAAQRGDTQELRAQRTLEGMKNNPVMVSCSSPHTGACLPLSRRAGRQPSTGNIDNHVPTLFTPAIDTSPPNEARRPTVEMSSPLSPLKLTGIPPLNMVTSTGIVDQQADKRAPNRTRRANDSLSLGPRPLPPLLENPHNPDIRVHA